MSKLTVGVAGVAGVGKDTFFQLFQKYIKDVFRQDVKRFAFADELKKETNDWCLQQYGIPSIDTPREVKELIRPFLVFHGNLKRNQSQGRHWIDILDEKIKKERGDSVAVVTDVRYQFYDRDEVSWLQKELDGILVHISLYEIKDGVKVFKQPPNEQEQKFDPIMKRMANFHIEWEKQPNGDVTGLMPHIHNFVTYLSYNNRI